MTVPLDPLNQPADPNAIDENPQEWIVHHYDSQTGDDKIIGFFQSREDADSALTGYQMNTPINVDDILETRQII